MQGVTSQGQQQEEEESSWCGDGDGDGDGDGGQTCGVLRGFVGESVKVVTGLNSCVMTVYKKL